MTKIDKVIRDFMFMNNKMYTSMKPHKNISSPWIMLKYMISI